MPASFCGERVRRQLRLTVSIAIVVWAGVTQIALGQQAISSLPLSGDLTDVITGETASFARPSSAYESNAVVVPPDTPRYETFAVATGAVIDLRNLNNLVPIALLPNLLIAASGTQVYGSTDGVNFQPRGVLPYSLPGEECAYGTPGGSLLVYLSDGQLWRSADAGETFIPVLQFPPGCYPAYWNFAALGTVVFVSEYGEKNQPDNPRRIYRSWDDGATWTVVYNPPAELGYHDHKIIADPSTGWVYQAHGDTTHGVLCSTDLGETWSLIHDFYQPTGGIVRPGAIYWGQDGGTVSVQRLDTTTGQWTWPLAPWRGFFGDYSRTGNIFGMAECAGAMYVGIDGLDELWASQDGLHWAVVAAPMGANGGEDYVGAFGGMIHGRGRQSFNYLRITPPAMADITGLRIEPGLTNRLDSPATSSFESGLAGATATPPSTLAWDTTHAFHGQASLRWTIPAGTMGMALTLPPVPAELPVGTTAYGQIRILGSEWGLAAFLLDAPHSVRGPITNVSARDEWGLLRSEMTVTQPGNSVQLIVRGGAGDSDVTVWFDGYQISDADGGSTWQLGGTPRAAEQVTLPVAFPASWTDLVYVQADFCKTDVTPGPGPRTLKAWVQDADHYAQLVYDASYPCFKLREVVAGQAADVCATPPVWVWPGLACRIAVRSGSAGADLRVVIGTAEYAGTGRAFTVQPISLWIGSSPAGNDGAPGVYALSRTFATRLPDAALSYLLNFLPGVPPPPADCNHNGVDDATDIANGTSQDMDWDGVPDECEPDCNSNGRPDDYDVANDWPDCNHNGQPDTCDLQDGTSADTNGNGIPDECDPDCNGNGVPDDLDILNGTSQDANGDGIPDECAPLTGDLNCDGSVDFGDINWFVLRLSNPAGYHAALPICPDANGDINGDGSVNFGDINPFVALLCGS
jgi:hypothetical protein